MQEKEHIISLFEKLRSALSSQDILQIKELSNQTIHSASIDQDPDNIALAVVVYSLSKILERTKYQDYSEWPKFKRTYTSALDNADVALKKGDMLSYRQQISKITDSIKKLTGNFKNYIAEIFRKSQINKASRIYEHGISLEKTAKILGITQWELTQYVGKTGIADVNLAYTKEIKRRLSDVESLFK
jgi:hypothetical protein